jgi:hypothetical protein
METTEITHTELPSSSEKLGVPELTTPMASPLMLPPEPLTPFPEYVDPLDMGYYYGLPDNPTLLARSGGSNSDTVSIPETYLDPEGIYRVQGKRAYEIEDCHPINAYLRRGLEKRIRNGIKGMIKEEFLMVEIRRIGFDEEPSKNPVVVLITVTRGTAKIDAEWVIEEIEKMIKQ